MSHIFQDEYQHVLQLPTEIWATILNFAICDPAPDFPVASRKAIILVLTLVSKQFYRLTNNIKLPIAAFVDNVTNYCGTNGFASLLKYALENGAQVKADTQRIIARSGHVDCLKVIVEDFRRSPDPDALLEATVEKHIHIAKYLIDKGVKPTLLDTIPRAVRSGHVEMFKLFSSVVDNFEYFPYLAQCAAESGNLEMVKYIEQYAPLQERNINLATSAATLQYFLEKGFRLNRDDAWKAAARRGDVEYLRLAIANGVPLTTDLMASVAEMNNVEFVKELREKGCPWDDYAIHQACPNYDVLKYLIDNGCPWEGDSCTLGPGAMANVTLRVARSGNIDCLKYLMDRGLPWPTDIIDRVMYDPSDNLLPTIQYLHKRGCRFTSADICTTAARLGNLDLLKYLHENNCPWDELTCAFAAKAGNLQCLTYALDNGCPWDDLTMDYAANSNSLATLKILFERGIPWNDDTCSVIMQNGQLEMLKYAHENGAPWTETTITSGLKSFENVLPCFLYAIENGCPWDPQEALNIATKYRNNTAVVQWIKRQTSRSNNSLTQ